MSAVGWLGHITVNDNKDIPGACEESLIDWWIFPCLCAPTVCVNKGKGLVGLCSLCSDLIRRLADQQSSRLDI